MGSTVTSADNLIDALRDYLVLKLVEFHESYTKLYGANETFVVDEHPDNPYVIVVGFGDYSAVQYQVTKTSYQEIFGEEPPETS